MVRTANEAATAANGTVRGAARNGRGPGGTPRSGASPATISGCALVLLGLIAGVGGALARPGHVWTYAIGGLIGICVGSWLIRAVPTWVPLGAAWITAVVAAVWVLTLGWAAWLAACAIVVMLAIAALVSVAIARR